jgi:hypothetical protein
MHPRYPYLTPKIDMVTNLPNTQHTIPKYGVVFIYVTGIWYISVFADVAGIDRSKLCDFFFV